MKKHEDFEVGDLIELNKIYNEDCLEGMKRIPDGSVDMILCDLPYGTTSAKWDSVLPLGVLWDQYERVIKENGAIVLTAAQPFTTTIIAHKQELFRYVWYWKKNRVTGFANAKKQPLRHVEDVVVFYKKRPNYNPQGLVEVNKTVKNGKSVGGETLRRDIEESSGKGSLRTAGAEYIQQYTNYPRQLLEIKSAVKTIHPTQKPVLLFEYLIKTYTNEGETVLDNCAGSFTTAVACDNTNRNWICMEKEEKYCNIGLTRINDNRERLSLPLLNSIN